ncbi:MAG: metal ABC transporter ATP-binding protein [Magnetococcales bacterium]|nr:metal ABC transporter ATP-binding protein [Magnetococcales bacterium]
MRRAIHLDNLTLGYERHPAVHHLSGVFQEGSLTAVFGPNGAGKSTLLKGILGLLPPLSGAVRLVGIQRRDLAFLPQQVELEPDFPMSVLDAVLMGHWRRRGAWGALDRELRQQAVAALETVGLSGFEKRAVNALSGGQRQRILFARLVVEDAPVILLDEPFAPIDAQTTADMLALVHRWREQGRTVIAVLHDLEQVQRHFPQTLLLARRALAWGPTEQALAPERLEQARSMSAAWNDHAPWCRKDPP